MTFTPTQMAGAEKINLAHIEVQPGPYLALWRLKGWTTKRGHAERPPHKKSEIKGS